MDQLRLPAPSLIVLVGPSASGKSTWAAKYFAPDEIVSSDTLRAVVGAGEDDQAASTIAFDLLDRIVTERMRRGRTTVIDTTGLDRKSRKGWIDMAREAGVPAHAIVFDTAPEVCERRNETAHRPVPKTVLRKQISRFKEAKAQLADDGFAGVHVEQPTAVVAVAVAAEGNHEVEENRAAPTHTFGLMVSRFDWGTAPGPTLATVARRAETAGFRDIWVMDHFARSGGWEDHGRTYRRPTPPSASSPGSHPPSGSARWSPASPTDIRSCSARPSLPSTSCRVDVRSAGSGSAGTRRSISPTASISPRST
jgi:predicted kinase